MDVFHQLSNLGSSFIRELIFWRGHHMSEDRKEAWRKIKNSAFTGRVYDRNSQSDDPRFGAVVLTKLDNHGKNRTVLLIVLLQWQKANKRW